MKDITQLILSALRKYSASTLHKETRQKRNGEIKREIDEIWQNDDLTLILLEKFGQLGLHEYEVV